MSKTPRREIALTHVIQMKVVEILAMNEEVEHIVALATDLQTSFYPVDLRGLEELGRLQRSEEILLGHSFRRTMLQFVQNEALEELLVGDPNFRGLTWRTVLEIPVLD